MKLRWGRWGLVLLAGALLWAGKYNTTVDIGKKAPSFTKLPSTDGKTWSLADFQEDVVVLVFLANH